ncbi:MAG: pyridoxal-phosphate dependent enzyme, partial [Caldiserica bacterium]|nr:pyridoxal-phosphate dependent enzyme [Caldisericota bacterium]
MRTNSILDLIGNTPVVELQHFSTNPRVRILAKLEGSNPGGSIKDRPVLSMFRDAEERGLLKPGSQLLEATSGNTGIAMAMI